VDKERVKITMHIQGRVGICKVSLSAVISLACLLTLPLSALAQSTAANQIEASAREREPSKLSADDAQEVQQRAFAVSLIISLGNEARGYDDLALRPRVLARAADVVWNSDPVTAQSLFRRAWEAAEKGDAEDVTVKSKDNPPSMVIALRRLGGKDLRVEVLNLVARRDRILAEEFLAKLKSATDGETEQSKGAMRSSDGWSTSEVISKRLQAASQLLNEGQIQSALELATPGLNQVTASSISFLTDLRAKNPEVADQRFAMLMARAELDPLTDANTVSGLSSYVFTPGFYITFSPDGSAVWSQPDSESAPPNLPPALRNRFFEVAGSILLRPLPPPDQDFSSSGRKGKYMVVKHLLPLFDQYAPDTAVALHAQLTELAGKSDASNEGFSPQDSKPSNSASDVLEKMQDEADHAKNSQERDEIFAAAAVRLAIKGDVRARDVANRIDDSERRGKVREYVDFEFIQLAIRNKDAKETARLAKIGQITHSQRAWAYTQATRLLPDSARETALEFLGEAMAEVQRIDDHPRDRAVLLVGVARRLLTTDRVRAWQTMSEAVKAANQADNFTGENQITYSIASRNLIKFIQIGGEESGLAGIFRLLAKDDLNRSVDLARSFKNDAPRATAILAIAGLLLDKQGTNNSNN
jgi:hypothetical protein